jgi:hypothetical protein
MATFGVEVKTADEMGAGTDSNIFLILHGEFGTSTEVRLNKHIKGNAFERNQTDRLELTDFPELGRIFKIRVRSDTSYAGSDWRLSYIRVYPRQPDYPSSIFRYENWIDNTDPRELFAEGWGVTYAGERSETVLRRTISAFDLLDSAQSLQQEYTVKYTLANQVELSSAVKDTAALSTAVKWESPSKIFDVELGKLTAEIKNEWKTEVDAKRVYRASWQLEVQDKRTLTFPAGKLTLVQAEWGESWKKALISLGSTALGMRWLDAVPANEGWTIKSFARGDVVPEPFAGWIRENRPDLAGVVFPIGDVGRVANGSTVPGATGWQAYGSVPGSLYVDVDTRSAGFTSTPRYFTSLGGVSYHWEAQGVQAIYSPKPTGFRVYVRAANRELTPEWANEKRWHIQWLGIESDK